MPSLGADMEAGTLVEWLVEPGDDVKRGDIIAVVDTQKGAIEIEVFQDGVVGSLLIEPGATVPVGTAMADILDGEPAPPPPPEAPIAPEPVRVSKTTAPPPPAEAMVPSADGVRASPAARRLAAAQGIDLSTVTGSGPGGAIQRADVEAAEAVSTGEPEVSPAAPTGTEGMRAAIAAAMVRSKREIPHYYLEHTIDMQAAADWLARTNAERPPAERLLIGALTVKAVAVALRGFSEFNGVFEDGTYRPSEPIHVGVAIAIRGGGLVAPAIHHTEEMSLDTLMAALRDLTERVRAGRFRGSELTDPTITVSSLGERGVEGLYGVIYPPQVALVGLGSLVERPWVVDSDVVMRPVMTATLSADHRVSDGHRGALFLRKVGALLQEPEAL